MKILISLSYYAPHISGLTNCVKNLAELLADHGDVITVLTAQHTKSLPEKENLHGVHVLRVPYLFKLNKGFIMPALFPRAFAAVRQHEAVFVVLPQLEGFVVALFAKLLGKKVYCLYACDVTLTGSLLGNLIEHVLRFANLLTLVLSQKIVILTHDYIQQLPFAASFKKKVVAIYPVMPTPVIKDAAQKKFEIELPKKKYHIGFLGRIAAEKGLEYLFAAIPLLQKKFGEDFVIVLAGPAAIVGEIRYQTKIAPLIQQYQSYIVQIGELAEDELGAFYAALDVLVIPSTNPTEAFGIVQVEAMLCGTPVVVSNLPGVRVPVQITGMGEVAKRKNSTDLAA